MNQNMEKCPHFNNCSKNICPLDLEMHLRVGSKSDFCKYMQEARLRKVQGREFVSGGRVMPDATLNFVPESNVAKLNNVSKARWREIKNN